MDDQNIRRCEVQLQSQGMLAQLALLTFLLLPIALCEAQTRATPASWQAVQKYPPRENRQLGAQELLPPSTGPNVRLLSGETSDGQYTLPNTHNQVWEEYDIRHYTHRYPVEKKPEQTIVDWILRETGTEMWFSQPLGVLSADRNTLRVYHTQEIQQIVKETIDRFQRPSTESFMCGVRMVTVSSPNWRTRALPRLTPVTVQTPGVEAWLLSHEDAAVVLAGLRKRTDFREYNSPNLLIRNGDTHEIDRMRPVAYLRGLRNGGGNPWGGYQMDMGQVQEGFSLEVSPLLSLDSNHLDAVVKIDSVQIERMKPISVAAPTIDNPRKMAQVQVPQTSSWRLHERFHWPANQVLLISCGVVSSPGPEKQTGLARMTNLLPRPPRSDALLFVDAKGRASEQLTQPQQQANSGGDINYRGRY